MGIFHLIKSVIERERYTHTHFKVVSLDLGQGPQTFCMGKMKSPLKMFEYHCIKVTRVCTLPFSTSVVINVIFQVHGEVNDPNLRNVKCHTASIIEHFCINFDQYIPSQIGLRQLECKRLLLKSE